jgi:hypothetical protein
MVALILILVLAIPTTIQITHLFENHEHVICTSNDVHLHEADVDCSICDYTYTPFNFKINYYPEFQKFSEIKIKSCTFISRYKNKKNSNPKSLRAPPKPYLS